MADSQVSAEFDLSNDRLDFGRYRSLFRAGHGGMAEVFLAVSSGPAGFQKLVAIKRPLPDAVAHDPQLKMFFDEARLAAQLSHPHIVQTFEVTEEAGSVCIVMEYLEGQSLGRIVRALRAREQRCEPRLVVRILADVLAGLHYAHELCDYDGQPLRVVHRDVSPQNIFVTYEGVTKILDFGIARAEIRTSKTEAGLVKGKAAYMAPEQLTSDVFDRRVDIFTTGIVLWEALTGQRLMAAESTAQTLWRVVREPIPRVSDFIPDIHPTLDAIVARALERDPDARYQTAQEMRDALKNYLDERGETPRDEELAALLSSLFAEHREQLKETIREHLAALEGLVGGVESGAVRVGASAASESKAIEDPSIAFDMRGTKLPVSDALSLLQTRVFAPSRSKTWVLHVAGALAAVTSVVICGLTFRAVNAPDAEVSRARLAIETPITEYEAPPNRLRLGNEVSPIAEHRPRRARPAPRPHFKTAPAPTGVARPTKDGLTAPRGEGRKFRTEL